MAVSSESLSGERMVALGCITGVFGIKGWVKVESYTDPPGNILHYAVWQLTRGASPGSGTESWQPVKLLDGRAGAKGIHAQLEGVADRTQAEGLRGRTIAVPRSELPQTEPGEYYWDDLLGLEAFSKTGERLGIIAEFRATTAHGLMSIVADDNGERVEHLVPLVKERLVAVDLSARRVTLDWDNSW